MDKRLSKDSQSHKSIVDRGQNHNRETGYNQVYRDDGNDSEDGENGVSGVAIWSLRSLFLLYPFLLDDSTFPSHQ